MKKWNIKSFDDSTIEEICRKTGYSKIFASILAQRGFKTLREIKNFITPKISHLYNPFLFNDMEKAVDRIRKAIDNKEKILIYGDRDVDGITSTNIAYSYLRELNADVLWYIPTDEGYGLHNEFIKNYHEKGVKLLITVDCGISAKQEVEYAKSLGIDVIITDHHEPPEEIPNAIAIIDPKCQNEKYPFKELAGCGVVFKLFRAIAFSYSEYYNKDMVIFDVETTGLSPITDEIVEIGAIKIRNLIEKERFSTLVKPRFPIPQNVTAIHGITNEDCKNAPDISEVIEKFLDFSGDSIFIAHNSDFDMAFINCAAAKVKRQIKNEIIDTLKMSRSLFKFESHALSALINEFDIETEKHHRALSDAEATMKIFERFVLVKEKKQKDFIEDYLYLVALGTIADIVPLISENRIFVKYGLQMFYNSKKPGIRTILDTFQIDKKSFTAKKISWSIVPVLNAAGRCGKVDLSVNLLMADSIEKAQVLMDEIININDDRKDLQKLNIKSFIDATIQQNDIENDKIFVTVVEGLKHGVTGIVASQMAKEFGRPIMLLILDGNEAIGSSRSIEGIDVISIIERCKDIIIKYGGHKAAAGLTISKDNIDEFKKRIKIIGNELITDNMLIPHLSVDMQLAISEVSFALMKEMELLEPCGSGNNHPVFIISDALLNDFSNFGIDGSHLRIQLKNGKTNINGIGWQLGRRAIDLKRGQKVNVVCRLEINTWQSKEYIQLNILDIKLTDSLF